MTNAHRGEIAATLGGRARRLVLTLGALAELETVFGVDGLVGVGERFESGRLGARDLAAIIAAGLRGAGETISDAEVAALTHPDGLPGYVATVSALLHATFGEATPPPRP
jgi:hypothetical protein